jgi:type I restriction enzyme S subunit
MTYPTITLGEICNNDHGKIQTGPFGSQLHESDYSDVGIPVVMPKDIKDWKISVQSIARISEDHVKRLSKHILKEGDIVYGRRGDIGRQAFVSKTEEGYFCGTGCLKITIGNNIINSKYLHYYLREEGIIKWIANNAIGATLPNLNTDILRRIPISIPPPKSQVRIVSILSAYDDLIENNTRRIKILEDMAKLIYREWFVEFKAPGVKLRKATAEEKKVTGKDQFPEGWEVKTLGNVSRITMGQSPESIYYNEERNGLPFHQGVTNFGDRFPTDKTFCISESRIAEKDDILMSVRAPVGRLNISSKKIIIGRGLCAVKSNDGNQEYLFQTLKNHFIVEDIMGGGTIFKSVTKDEVVGIRIIYPTHPILEKYKKILKPIFSELKILTNKNQILRHTRDLLLPKLVSGKIEV